MPRIKPRLLIIVSGMLPFVMVFGCLMLAVYALSGPTNPEMQAARATESTLTISHGAEAHRAIEAFINRKWSFAAFGNPNLLSKVATGQALKELKVIKYEWSLGTITIIRSASISRVQVIDFTPARFKAFSCETLNFDSVTLDGVYVSSIQPLIFFRIYVFNRENEVWKEQRELISPTPIISIVIGNTLPNGRRF